MGLPTNLVPISETFFAVQGEGVNIGIPYYFIRVAGCPLRCNFCDQEAALVAKKDQLKSVDEIISAAIEQCHHNHIKWISITGGEPMIYPNQLIKMMTSFKEAGLHTHIETSGRFHDTYIHNFSDLYSPDAKTPSTGEQMEGFFLGVDDMRSCDQVKCLIGSNADLDYAHKLNEIIDGRCHMILQPFNDNIKTENLDKMSDQQKSRIPNDEIDISQLRWRLCSSLAWLLDAVKKRQSQGEVWRKIRITPQIHVLAFGNAPGV